MEFVYLYSPKNIIRRNHDMAVIKRKTLDNALSKVGQSSHALKGSLPSNYDASLSLNRAKLAVSHD